MDNFQDEILTKKTLYNAIQIAKKNLAIRQNYDASDMLQYLYSQKAEDSRWFIETKFDGPECRLCGLIWMSPDQQHAWTRYGQLDPLKTKWAVCYINIQFTGRIQEYKDEIPSIGLENVAQRYFTSIEKIVSDYLMAPMIIPVYTTEDNYNEGVREDHYEIAKILLGDISANNHKI
ncbi:unnamed protein product [Rhizophagus irregularis]|nr:unnamed protein product [Rhizophagus irregularis]